MPIDKCSSHSLSNKFLLATDGDHYKKAQRSKCRENLIKESPATVDNIYNTTPAPKVRKHRGKGMERFYEPDDLKSFVRLFL